MPLSEADARAKLIDPAIHARGWSEDLICRETTLGQVEIIGGKETREASNKADDIENAVYDLKAVNPNRKVDVDRRTPTELLDLIQAKGREVAEAIDALRTLSRIG